MSDLNAASQPIQIDQALWRSRLAGMVSPAFHTRTILTVGVGAGSYTVEKLVRLWPAHVKNVDPDVVELQNLVRTGYAMRDVGQPKVVGLERRLAEINPMVRVSSYAVDLLTMSEDQLAELFAGVDLVVAGTDRFEAQAMVNTLAVRHRVPAVFVGIHAGALGGRVCWYMPGETGCYRCMAPERYEEAERARVAGEVGALNLEGAAGALPDCAFIDAVAFKIMVAILERGQDSQYGRFYEQMKHRNDVIVRCDPGYAWGGAVWDALLADLPTSPKRYAEELKRDALFAMDSIWMVGGRGCGGCGGSARVP